MSEREPGDWELADHYYGNVGDPIHDDREVTLYACPVCGQDTVWFECESWDRGDPSTPFFESGYGPTFHQACACRVTQRQIDAFPIDMGMCAPSEDDPW